MTEKPNHIEATRAALELAASHGLGAHRHAKELAEEAAAKGDTEQQAFWKAVAAELSPHCSI